MPRGIRIGPSVARTLSLFLATGVYTGSYKQMTPRIVRSSGDAWTMLNDGQGTTNTIPKGPYIGSGWYSTAVRHSTGQLFMSWGSPSSTINQRGAALFNPTTNLWERTSPYPSSALWDLGSRENYDIDYDPVRDRFFITQGAPLGWSGYPSVSVPPPWPLDGDLYYDCTTTQITKWGAATDEAAWPTIVNTGRCIGKGDNAAAFWNDSFYTFGGYSVGASQALARHNVTTDVITFGIASASTPPMTTQSDRLAIFHGSCNHRYGMLYLMGDGGTLYQYDLSAYGPGVWQSVATTGQLPGDIYAHYVVDEKANCLVGWIGMPGNASGDPTTQIGDTYVLDLASRVWRYGPRLVNGDTVPPRNLRAACSMCYDPAGQRTYFTNATGVGTAVWAFHCDGGYGSINSFPLPTSSGGVFGVNYFGFPYRTNGSSKHTNMAYCPLNNRIYVSGGDTNTSAADGTWSMSMVDGSWRLDVGKPNYPTLAAPHAYQDGCLFTWMPSRNKFLFGFGGVFGYEPDGDPLYNYSNGYWMFDPITNTWEQRVNKFWSNPTLDNAVNGTGNEYGGVYDEITDTVYVLGEGVTVALGAKRYNIATEVQDSTIPFTIPSSGIPGYSQAVFGRTRQCQLGRYIYAVGYYSNGINKVPGFWRWGIDDHTFVRLADPPAFTTTIDDKELVLVKSHGKICHPRRNGPEGNMPDGMLIYDPATNVWTQDTKAPAYGNYIANSVCEIPDGRIAMAGGVFGLQQTHFWFYEVL